MKISKYLHSCLLFEQHGYQLLFDPGKFSFADGRVSASMFANVQSIIITHIHPDHYDAVILKSIIAVNKDVAIYTNKQVGAQMEKDGISYILMDAGEHCLGTFNLTAISVTHEPLLDNPIPEMHAFVINDKALYHVDTLSNELINYKGIELLCLVTMAPFANEVKIAAFADSMQPKQVFPVHDGYAHNYFVKQRYANYKRHFEKQGIIFHEVLEVGQSIELE